MSSRPSSCLLYNFFRPFFFFLFFRFCFHLLLGFAMVFLFGFFIVSSCKLLFDGYINRNISTDLFLLFSFFFFFSLVDYYRKEKKLFRFDGARRRTEKKVHCLLG